MDKVKCKECDWQGKKQQLIKGEISDDPQACPSCFGTEIEEESEQ